MAGVSDDDKEWLNSLSESEIDFLVTLKKLAFQRAVVIGHADWADKFDLKMLRTLGYALMRYVKDRVLDVSIPGLHISPAVFEGCNLLKCDPGDISPELFFFVESLTQQCSTKSFGGEATNKRKRDGSEEDL